MTPALAARLDRFLADAHARWPDLEVNEADFVGYLGDHLAAEVGGEVTAEEALAAVAVHAADFYLAFACVEEHPAALAAFDRELLAHVGRYVARFRRGPEFADDVRQLVRERLLIAAPGGVSRIAAYAGRGPLLAWVRVATMRVALNRLHQLEGEPDDHRSLDDLTLPAASTDPAVTLLKARHGAELQEALNRALTALTAKERTLLHMHYVDGVTLDRMATAYSVHRATIARWLQSACADLFERTCTYAKDKMALPSSEMSSLLGLLVSQLHVSLHASR